MEQQVQQETNHVITSTQINQIIQVLDQVVKAEGISLQSSGFLINSVVKPLVELPQITINQPEEGEQVNE
ncbi:hypothetical protein IACHDJAJ_00060 [Aeromonas phage vB_AdhS_TS3]|nr:hypothetical protein IACHDJAJ_00060 [Aeromonas phage vB_AdhS_TS3]